MDQLCADAEAAVRSGINIIILSDRAVAPDRVPIPALLAVAGVHHHLIREGLRTSVGLVVETGDAREVHHFCALAGYGAEAINPYLAFETLSAMKQGFPEEVDDEEVVHRYIKAIDKGILKVIAKMGISTYQSYCGAQIFDAVGLSSDFVKRYFTGTATTIEGVGLAEIAEETLRRHRDAFGDSPVLATSLAVGGDYAFRLRGESHVWRPETVAALQHAARGNAQDKYREFARLVNETEDKYLTIRSLFRIKGGGGGRPRAGAARRGRAGGRDRPPLLDRRDVLRLDQPRGAHHARHRHEPDRRQVEHRRGRRGDRTASRRSPTAIRCARRSSRSPRAASA